MIAPKRRKSASTVRTNSSRDTLLLGLLARFAGDHDRNAARIARAILGPADPAALAAAMTALGLS